MGGETDKRGTVGRAVTHKGILRVGAGRTFFTVFGEECSDDKGENFGAY